MKKQSIRIIALAVAIFLISAQPGFALYWPPLGAGFVHLDGETGGGGNSTATTIQSCAAAPLINSIGAGLPDDVWVDVITFSQLFDVPGLGYNACVPVSGYIVAEYLDRISPDLSFVEPDGEAVVRELYKIMNTTKEGTSLKNFHRGLAKYFASKGLTGLAGMSDIKMVVYGNRSGDGVTGGEMNPDGFKYGTERRKINRLELRDALVRGAVVFFSVILPDVKDSNGKVKGHAMVLSGMYEIALPGGNILVEFSDPWTNDKIVLQMDDDGHVYDVSGILHEQQQVIVLERFPR